MKQRYDQSGLGGHLSAVTEFDKMSGCCLILAFGSLDHRSITVLPPATSWLRPVALLRRPFLFLVMLLLGGFLLSVGAPTYPNALLPHSGTEDRLVGDAYAAVSPSALRPFASLGNLCYGFFVCQCLNLRELHH